MALRRPDRTYLARDCLLLRVDLDISSFSIVRTDA